MRRSPEILANSIRLKRQVDNKCFLVVEGRDDRKFFEHFVDETACSVTVANGKPNVTEVIARLENDQFPGIIGVVDADLDHIEGYQSLSDNLIILETADLEALLIRSSALDRVLVELGSRDKITRFRVNVREVLVTAAVWIAYLRLHSIRDSLSLRFKGIKYKECIIDKTLSINPEALVQGVLNRSQLHGHSCMDIVAALRLIHESKIDPWLICYGKDMIGILSVGLRKTLGSNNANDVTPEIINRELRLAFDWDDMNRSEFGQNLRAWSKRNPGYWILNPTESFHLNS